MEFLRSQSEHPHRTYLQREALEAGSVCPAVGSPYLFAPCIGGGAEDGALGLDTDLLTFRPKIDPVVEIPYSLPFLLSMDASSIPYIITDTAYSMFYLLFRTSVFVCTEVLR